MGPRTWHVREGDDAQTRLHWDPQGLILSLELSYPPPKPSLGHLIAARIGVRPVAGSLILGPVELGIDEGGRIRTVDVRANPASWSRCSLPPPPPRSGMLILEGPVDEGPMGVEEHLATVWWDRDARRLRVTLGNGASDGHFVRLGEHLSVSLTRAGALHTLTFEDLPADVAR